MLKRMWVNQPSTLQPFHKLHGRRVFAVAEEPAGKVMRVYFCENTPVVSMNMPRLCLSDGWPMPYESEDLKPYFPNRERGYCPWRPSWYL